MRRASSRAKPAVSASPIANRQDKVHAFVGRQGHGFVDQLVSSVAFNRAAAEKHALEQGAIERAQRRRNELITRVLVASQHDQCLGAAIVGNQSPAPASHVPIRNQARRHTKPIVDHYPHNPSVLYGGINR